VTVAARNELASERDSGQDEIGCRGFVLAGSTGKQSRESAKKVAMIGPDGRAGIGGGQKSRQFLFKIQNPCYILSHSRDVAAAPAPAKEKGMHDRDQSRSARGRRWDQDFFYLNRR
jgi:hypothetical protein